jgi:hypothetical protein
MVPFFSIGSVAVFINFDSVAEHSHALGLFFLYLFIHFGMAAGSKNDESPLVRSTSSLASQDTRLHSVTSLTKSRRVLGKTAPLPIRSDSSQSAQSDDDDDADTVTSSIGEDTPVGETALEKSCPESTPAERQRFLLACNGNTGQANQRLQEYLNWRRNHERIRTECNIRIKQSSDPDYDIWVESCLVALKACGEVAENIVLPRVVRSYSTLRLGGCSHIADPTTRERVDVVDQEGHRIFHMIPGLMDDKLAKTSTYALAVAIYFDRRFDPASLERVTVCMDVRAGKGWPNIHGLRLIPFMKNSLKLLLPTFPERLHKCIVYPVPTAFLYVWTMISKCMDPVTREKICVVSGKCTIVSLPPMEDLIAHLGEESVTLMEDTRVACFKA